MAVDSAMPRSRRALLGAAVGGAVAVVAQAVGRPLPVHAEGQTMVVGGEYTDATSKTYIANNTNSDFVFAAQSTQGGTAVHGRSTKIGVEGQSDGTGWQGIRGKAVNGIGVYGEGRNGVYGASEAGVAVTAVTSTGKALVVNGPVEFSRSALSTIPVGKKSATVNLVAYNITASTLIIATLETNQGGLYLKNVLKDVGAKTMKFTLSANVASGKYAKIAWFLLR